MFCTPVTLGMDYNMQIWMCVNKDLTAVDCKESKAEESRCREVLFPTLVGE